ncbi:MAG: hypothetical protein IJ802_06670 [Kiritimatiellae bacterium]|nr:hypothetical protein [Kiritimatiellia bacterium]
MFARIAMMCAVACAAGLAGAAPAVVKIEGKEGAWKLTVNGKEFFARGGGGGGSKSLLAEIGGNTFRTWAANGAKKDLAEAEKNGLMVMLGFWLGHAEHGFDYTNEKALVGTAKEVIDTVREVRNHPALLCYTLGNEMELGEKHPREMWTFINRLAKKIHELDPNHPVGTVVADIWQEKTTQIMEWAPELDFLGLNSYGGATSVGLRWRLQGGKMPYFITEFGPGGPGDHGRASNGIALEETSTRKAAWYKTVWEKIVEDKGYCLGGYVFTWGWKNECSPTWYGTMLPDGTRLEVVNTLARLWGKPLKNRCPRVVDVKVSKDKLAEGEEFTASVIGRDPDGDKITWEWALVDEHVHYGKKEKNLRTPPAWKDAIVSGQGTDKVRVKLPGGGKYRLYAFCFDSKGNAAYANHPVAGEGREPKRKETK